MIPRSRVLGLLAAATCLLLNLGPLTAQETWYSEQFMSESGLLQNRVHDMVKDRWGALLIGTEGGLVRFDGHHFRQIGINSPEGMKPSRVLEIILTTEGKYVVRDAGCRQYVYEHDSIVSITGDAPTRQYTSRFTGSIGSVAATVKAMDPDSSQTRKGNWPAVVRAVPLADGSWCLRSAKELLVYRDTVFEAAIPLPAGRSSHLFAIGDFAYVLDDKGAVFRIDTQTRSVVPVILEGFPEPEVKNGLLTWRLFWNAQERNATFIAGDRLYTINAELAGAKLVAEPVGIQLPQGVKVGAIVWLEGRDALALGTDNKGLFIYRKQQMRSLVCEGLTEGVNNSYSAQAVFGMDGIITSSRGGARIFDHNGCSTTPAPFKGFNEGAIHVDGGGRYWYGRGDTLFRYDVAAKAETIVRQGMRPLCFYEKDAVLWIGSGAGVFRVEKDALSLAYPLAQENIAQRPNDLCVTPAGEFWMATCSGVLRRGPGEVWEAVPGLEKVCARTLEVVGDAVLIGTYGSGAFVQRDGRVVQLRRDERGSLSHVHAFMPDQKGFIWMSTNQGLFRMRLTDLIAWTADTTLHSYYAYYGKKAGLSNAEFNGGCSPSYVRTRDGWASFPTMDGLAWFNPEGISDAYPAQELRIEGVTVNGVARHGDVALPSDHGDLVVAMSIAYWGDPENVRLEYTLGNEEAEWTVLPAGQRELRFSGLPAGDHVLRVRKLGAPLRGDTDRVSLHIAVATPLYRKPWFILSASLGTVLLFFGAVRFNASRLRRRNTQLERKVADRTRELVEANTDLRRSLEMKEMLVSIISHDIVTPLRFIARVAGGASRRMPSDTEPRLVNTLSDLANSSEKLHANAQGLLQWVKRQDGRIELRPKNIVVHLLVEEVMDRERERAAENNVTLNNLISIDDIIRADRNVLSIILHNAIGNAVTHSGGASVSVQGESINGRYRLTVKDSGGGMPDAVLRHAKRVQAVGALGAMGHEGEREVQGLGLLIIADLTQLMGGEFSVDSGLGQGTTVCVTIPV